jgi:hypothetical protein
LIQLLSAIDAKTHAVFIVKATLTTIHISAPSSAQSTDAGRRYPLNVLCAGAD